MPRTARRAWRGSGAMPQAQRAPTRSLPMSPVAPPYEAQSEERPPALVPVLDALARATALARVVREAPTTAADWDLRDGALASSSRRDALAMPVFAVWVSTSGGVMHYPRISAPTLAQACKEGERRARSEHRAQVLRSRGQALAYPHVGRRFM